MEKDDVGIILPMLPEHVARVFDRHKNVIPKFISRIPKKTREFRLKPGMKVVFYVSHSGRVLTGEAEIESLEFLPAKSAFEKYGNRFVLSKNELDDYVFTQPRRTYEKPLLVVSLKKILRYRDGIRCAKNISMVGEFITQEDYGNIFKMR